jgi:hypothetical protein
MTHVKGAVVNGRVKRMVGGADCLAVGAGSSRSSMMELLKMIRDVDDCED